MLAAELDKNTVTKVNLRIEGKETEPVSGKYFDDNNPLNDSIYAVAALAPKDDVNLAVQTAHRTFLSYRDSAIKDREELLCNAADQLQRKRRNSSIFLSMKLAHRSVRLDNWSLYNMATDPAEQHYLADEYPDKLLEMIGDWNLYAKEKGVIPGSPPLGGSTNTIDYYQKKISSTKNQ